MIVNSPIYRQGTFPELERAYFSAWHYLQMAHADPAATLTDLRDCLAHLTGAHDAWLREYRRLLRANGLRIPAATSQQQLNDYIASIMNARWRAHGGNNAD